MLANHFHDFLKLRWLLIVAALALVGCERDRPRPGQGDVRGPSGGPPGGRGPKFLDSVETNTEVPADLESLVFTDTDGGEVALQDFVGKKPILLVFTQGFSGSLCPFCITQVSRLIVNYDSFKQRDVQVLVVYPGKRDHLSEFLSAAKSRSANVTEVPFPILLDEDLKAANFFNIESQLAHPSTFLIDKSGAIKLAFVGADRSAERPSIQALLDIIDSDS